MKVMHSPACRELMRRWWRQPHGSVRNRSADFVATHDDRAVRDLLITMLDADPPGSEPVEAALELWSHLLLTDPPHDPADPGERSRGILGRTLTDDPEGESDMNPPKRSRAGLVMAFEFVDELPSKTVRRPNWDLAEVFVEALKARPGRWAKLPDEWQHRPGMAHAIKNGYWKPFRPGSDYHAIYRNGITYVRYVGLIP